MTNAKQKAIEWIESMPDECTLDDIRYQLYFRESVEKGLRDLEEGHVVPHEEVKRRTKEWLAEFGQIQQ